MSEQDFSEKATKLRFWRLTCFYILLGSALVWLSVIFIDIEKNPIALFAMIPIIIAFAGSSIWCHGYDFQRKFGNYPWGGKPKEDDEWMGELHD